MSKKEYWKTVPNKEKVILDLCGGTGAWSQPYKNAGYNVINITHPDYDVFGYDDYKLFIGSIYGILAAPTCTQFSFARTTAKTPRDLASGMELVDRCLKIIRDVSYGGTLKFWALENPMGYLRQLLGKPYLVFNPNEYGDNYTKKTDVWGFFNLPKKNIRELTEDEKYRNSINNRILPSLPEGYILPDNFRPIQAKRSMTSLFFAEAFFKSNK